MAIALPARRSSFGPKVFIPVVVLAAVLALGLLGACDDDKKITVPTLDPDYLEQSSAVNVLENLRTSYVKRSYAQYEKLFATDFMFVFNPADVDDPINPTPQQWARAEEMDAARNLFNNDHVAAISLNWSVGDLTEDDTHGSKVRVDDVLLDVTTRNEIGEVWIYQVKGATHVFYFRQEDAMTPFGHKKWTCTRWEDSPIGFAGLGADGARPTVAETSWGAIKNLFGK